MQLHWDIFCRVVDNYGDIGVCWRLARQLAAEHGKRVRLWVDDLASLQPLCPVCDPALSAQALAGVEVRHWTDTVTVDWFAEAKTADVVVEAFACELPPDYIAGMAQRPAPPVWLNLEYLSAESWVESCHGMASPHPSLPLTKHFVFPGFSSSTAGLPREAGLPSAPLAALPAIPEISLFCYATAPVASLLEAFTGSPRPLRCLVPPGQPLAAVRACLGGDGPWQLGLARIEPIPFLAQDDYDALLRRCAINFVRGEDSFVRAQWAGRPFVWQIYRQDDDAHRVKLDAFLDRYCAGLAEPAATALRALFLAWNTGADCTAAWSDFLGHHDEIAQHAAAWNAALRAQPDLATNLVKFCAARV
ncbi:elongation factor P maturation arginine rhamnosyltransferase EarP [Azonexus fungiphilus]|nr:elongation factor P maturation arginine rhamnosyltransferase EarP [Azonexus fungiphilus]